MRFVHRSVFRAPASVVFGFHERPDAFALLAPPWQTMHIVQPPSSLAVGTRVVVRLTVGLVPVTIVSEHVAYQPGRSFEDRMVQGPFASFHHKHLVEPRGPEESELIDDITYELPLGALGKLFGGRYVERELLRLFTYRHEVTRRTCEAR